MSGTTKIFDKNIIADPFLGSREAAVVLQQIDLQVGFGSSWFAASLNLSDMMLLAKSERRGLLVI